ncbi:MAG: imidazoleglycerol-phosphate dehydratase HisB [Verrucomicrobiota bacterium]
MASERMAQIHRKTAETEIDLTLHIDGTGQSEVDTGIGFLDHMLTLFSRHGLFDLKVKTKGDLHVDLHHTVEDTGIVLGQCFVQALGSKKGLVRYGHLLLPMDETLARVVVDFSGRPYHVFHCPEQVDAIGGNFPFSLVEEFFRALCFNAAVNLHQAVLYGRDAHHMAEALFKGTARSMDMATQIDARISEIIPSTKESL